MWLPRHVLSLSHSPALLTSLIFCSLTCHAISVPKREPTLLCDGDALSPCQVARELVSYYNVTLAALPASGSSPDESTFPSVCSTVVYAIVSACTTCRGASHMPHWSQWSADCSHVYLGHLPEPAPADLCVPAWAYVDVTQEDSFNLADAQPLRPKLQVNARQDSSDPYAIPSFTSTPSFVYPYPIPTSFSVPSYSFSFSIPSYTFSVPSYSFSFSIPSYTFSIPSYTIPSYTIPAYPTPTYNLPTAALGPEYTVPSIPTGLSSPEEHGGGGKISSGKRKVNLKAIIGSIAGAISSITALIGGVWAWMKRRAKRALGLSRGDNAHAMEQQRPFLIHSSPTHVPHVPYAHPAPPLPPPGPYVPTVY